MKAVTADDAIRTLNELFALEPLAMRELFSTRVPVGDGLVNHPTVQVGMDEQGYYRVSPVGILNGIFGCDDNECGYIASTWENGVMTGFARYVPKGGDE